MGIYAIKPKFQQALRPIEKVLVNNKVNPTALNILALLLSGTGGVIFYVSGNNLSLLFLIPLIAFVRTALNALDGMVARALKVKNQQWGEILNEFCDRLSDIALFLGLAFAPYTNRILGFMVLILILVNSYFSILSKAAGGSRQYGGCMGKADRMFYLSIMSLLVALLQKTSIVDITLWFIGIGTIMTLAQRYSATKKELCK